MPPEVVAPNSVTAADVYALGQWIVKVLYVVVGMVSLKLLLTGYATLVTRRAAELQRQSSGKVEELAGRVDAMLTKLGAMVAVAKAEGVVTDAQHLRVNAIHEKAESVLTQIRDELPRVAHDAVQQAVSGIPSPSSEGVVKTIPVVVVNAPDHPVPVAAPADAPPRWKPGQAPLGDE